MTEKIRFGFPIPEFRTDYGTLRTRELEKIISFLNRKGVLIADCFDRKVVIVHPCFVREIQEEMINVGYQPLLIGATVSNLRKNENLNLAQNRILEALTPGALIINPSSDNAFGSLSVAIPDNLDLRDICSSYEGTIRVFITNTCMEEDEMVESLRKMKCDWFNLNKIGILEYPYFDEDPAERIATVVCVYGPNNIKLVKEGTYDLETVKQASSEPSQYEIGEWA